MAITKVRLEPIKTEVKTTQEFTLYLNGAQNLKNITLFLELDTTIENCIDVVNITPLSSSVEVVLPINTGKHKELKITAKGPFSEDAKLLSFEVIPNLKCKLTFKVDRERVSFSTSSEEHVYLTTFRKSLKVYGEPMFNDTVTPTISLTPSAIPIKTPTPTPPPEPKNWQGFAIINLLVLSVIFSLIWAALKFKAKAKKNPKQMRTAN